ncbi:hypothetical protein PCASD_01774 [Puccinia coronata f. sp. avenae]|nr:hypothetical protein PCASD_01774 [Puccinia coronata f. sp. avenae]
MHWDGCSAFRGSGPVPRPPGGGLSSAAVLSIGAASTSSKLELHIILPPQKHKPTIMTKVTLASLIEAE